MAKNKREKQVSASPADDGGSRPHRADMEQASTLPLWKCYDYVTKLVFDPNHVAPACYLILVAELVLNYVIVENVPYTEIDWRAYMQEVEGFLNGTMDYSQLKGDTGPCVYPAGFIYIYSLLYYVTNQGTNIKLAQYIFIGIYILQSYLTYNIVMKTCKLPGYALLLSFVTSYRIHSIYVLRLFNDPIAVLFFWMALNAFVAERWKVGSMLFSLAVSIKMNILLYAPCLLIAYIANLRWMQVIGNLAICAFIQLMLGLPFLATYPVSYLRASFDLGRVFEHKWTVNYRFLDAQLFADARFHIALLVLHVSLLALFMPSMWRYFRAYRTLRTALGDLRQQTMDRSSKKKTTKKQRNKQLEQQPPPPSSSTYAINFSKVTQLFVLPFFATNLVGVACARSLHYQFYAWYFHSLLYVAFSTPFGRPLALLLLGLLETAWNVYPSTAWSSATLHVVHATLLYGLYKTMRA